MLADNRFIPQLANAFSGGLGICIVLAIAGGSVIAGKFNLLRELSRARY